jgi:hypothetical protein
LGEACERSERRKTISLGTQVRRVLAVMAIGIWAPDALMRLSSGHDGLALLTYAGVVVAQIAIWLVLVRVISQLRVQRPKTGKWVAKITGGALAFCAYTVVGYYGSRGVDPHASEYAFGILNPGYTSHLIEGNAEIWQLLLVAIGVPCVAHAFDWVTRATAPPAPVPDRLLTVFAGLAFIGLIYDARLNAPADVRGAAIFARTLIYVGQSDREMPDPKRPKLEPFQAAETPDVIIFLHESLSAQAWHPWNPGPSQSPRISAYLEENKDEVVWFPKAMANSSATHVSVPSLLTGLASYAPRDEFRSAPLAWHYAKAAGYHTALISVQLYEWANLDGFLVSRDAPDLVMTAAEFQHATVSDGAVDDARMIDVLRKLVRDTPADQPLFAVVQFGATHQPGYAGPDMPMDNSPVASWTDNYARSAHYVDEVNGKLLDMLAEEDRLANTVLIGTSDHGELPVPGERPWRIENFDEPVARIPMWIRLPAPMVAQHPERMQALRLAAETRVSNVDVVPTLLDLWGQRPEKTSPVEFAGDSWLQPVPKDRFVFATNTGGIRVWDREVLAAYRGDEKWLADGTGAYFCDLAKEPWCIGGTPLVDAPETVQLSFMDQMAKRPLLRRMLGRIDPVLPKPGQIARYRKVQESP